MANQYTNLPSVVDMSDLNRKDFTKKEWDAEYNKRYQHTEQNKATKKRYRQSEKGKARDNRYQQTDKYKARRKRYRQTDTYKAIQKRYKQTDKYKAMYKATIKRHRQTNKYKATVSRYGQTDKYKAMRKCYRQTDAYKALNRRRCEERRAKKLNATVSWSDKTKVNAIFAQATRKTIQTGKAYDVDHIIPLRGEAVCGLHVEGNLRVILASTNHKKNNHFTPSIEQSVLRLMARDQARNNCQPHCNH